ncbi:MAG: PE-PPE domain-containing protein [Actinomycetia bacterium]|nr:PE-PPE domain-containing protein [Actinomycetes bacterium]
MNRATKAAMTAALPFMALPLTLAGPLPTAAAAANASAASELIPPGPATVLHTSPTPWSVPHHLGGVLCADTLACQEVYYQAIQSYGPIELGLAENVRRLDFAINNTSGDRVAYGFSGGARVVSAWLQQQAESGAPAEDTNIVLLGNSGRKYGGINGFFWGNLFNMLMTPTDTGYDVLDVAREYDPIADFPDNPFNLLALANAWAGFNSIHLSYSQVDLDAPGNYVWKEGNTTYVHIPTQHLPILQGLRNVGLGALADQWEAPLREIIDRGYDRDYLENATVIPETIAEEESIDSVQPASSTAAAVTGEACSGYNTDGCDILARQSYQPVTAPDLENPAWQNILPNLFNAVAGIPRAYLDGLNDLSHALEVTGSWWVYTPTNVLGYDPADPPKITSITNLTIPFKALSNPLGEHLSWWAKGNLPMNAGCTGTAPPTCQDANGILSEMFQAPIWDFINGYQFPELINPVSDAEGAAGEEIPGEEGAAVPWSEEAVQLNPMDPVYSVINYLLAPPEQNIPEPITFDEVVQALARFGAAAWLNFNPFVPGSFLWKGAPYTLVTPLLKPFVGILCPQCDPEHPEDPTPFEDDGLPPSSQPTDPTVTTLVASATEAVDGGNSAKATLVEATAAEPAPAEPAPAEQAPAEEAAADETVLDENAVEETVEQDTDSAPAVDLETTDGHDEGVLDDELGADDTLTEAQIDDDEAAEDLAEQEMVAESQDESEDADQSAAIGNTDADSATEESTSPDPAGESETDSATSTTDASSGGDD